MRPESFEYLQAMTRTHSLLLLSGLLTIASPAFAQDHPTLADIANQVGAHMDTAPQSVRVYTNADLKMRPAPVPSVTPPFPAIAPPSGILEHGADPDIVRYEPAPMPEPYGVPLWGIQMGIGPWFSPSTRRPFVRPQRQGMLLLPPRSRSPSILRKPVIDLFAVDHGFRSPPPEPAPRRAGSSHGPTTKGSSMRRPRMDS